MYITDISQNIYIFLIYSVRTAGEDKVDNIHLIWSSWSPAQSFVVLSLYSPYYSKYSYLSIFRQV